MQFSVRTLLIMTAVCSALLGLWSWFGVGGAIGGAVVLLLLALVGYFGKLAHNAGRARYFYTCLASVAWFPVMFFGLPEPYIVGRIVALLIGLSLVIVAIRHGHITTKLIGLLTTLLYVVTVALVCWLFWPTVDTLVYQARNNDTRGMKRSLFFGVDPNEAERRGWNGTATGNTALTAAVTAKSGQAMRLLLENGSDPNQINGYSHAPLCAAVRQRRIEFCRLLVEHGADPNLCETKGAPEHGGGWNALDWAVFLQQAEIVEYLKENGAVETGKISGATIEPSPIYHH